MKKVLIITYYWPPAGGIEVYRVVKFCKYLRDFGWDPIVLTVKDGTAQASDPKLSEETQHVSVVGKANSIEPHGLFYALTGKQSAGKTKAPQSTPKKKTSFLRSMGEFIRLNVFIPDARIGWYPGAVKEGKKMIEAHKPDLIFSTAPPYTVHLIAASLQKASGLPWVADFRDPWVENYAYNTMYRFPWIRAINQRMEKRVLNQANHVIVATHGQQKLQGAKAHDGESRFTTITNGHDLNNVPNPIPTDKFYLSYFGSLSAQRVPLALFDAIAQLIKTHSEFAENFCFRFAGRITPQAQQLIEERIPPTYRTFFPLLPHHEYEQLVREQQVLLVLVDQVPNNDMIIPAKCFEMITTGNPLLAIAPIDGDTDHLLQTTETGRVVDYQDATAMKTFLLEMYDRWKNNQLNLGAQPFRKYHRKTLTHQLSTVFGEATP